MPVLRVIDANANRAREALRVMEEAARFLLDDVVLSAELKRLRHEISAAVSVLGPLDQSRDTPGDVGRRLTTETERTRATPADVVRAAGKRLGEALRAIEEYGKLLDVDVAAKIEQARYKGYDLEQRLNRALDTSRGGKQWTLCVIVSEMLCRDGDWVAVTRAAIAGGADCVQLREKTLDDRMLLARTRTLVELAGPRVSIIVNDRPDIAVLAGAAGVHLGQTDLPCVDVRRRLGPGLLIGVSTSNRDQAEAAHAAGADYCGVGPMFPTRTKPKNEIAGPEALRAYVEWGRLPHLAIGGITPDNVEPLTAVGGRGIAVSRVVCGAADPEGVTRKLRQAMAERPVQS